MGNPFANCKEDAQHGVSDVLGGMLHGALGLFGMGSLVDPLGDAKAKYSKAMTDLNMMTATDTLQAVSGLQTEMIAFIKVTQEQKELTQLIIKEGNDTIWDSIKEENLFISILFVLILIIVFFQLIK